MSAPNLEGIQASVPAGMVKDSSGSCATPPSALVTATPTSVADRRPVAKPTPKAKAKIKKTAVKKKVAKKKAVKKKVAKKKAEEAVDGREGEASCAPVHSVAH